MSGSRALEVRRAHSSVTATATAAAADSEQWQEADAKDLWAEQRPAGHDGGHRQPEHEQGGHSVAEGGVLELIGGVHQGRPRRRTGWWSRRWSVAPAGAGPAFIHPALDRPEEQDREHQGEREARTSATAVAASALTAVWTPRTTSETTAPTIA